MADMTDEEAELTRLKIKLLEYEVAKKKRGGGGEENVTTTTTTTTRPITPMVEVPGVHDDNTGAEFDLKVHNPLVKNRNMIWLGKGGKNDRTLYNIIQNAKKEKGYKGKYSDAVVNMLEQAMKGGRTYFNPSNFPNELVQRARKNIKNKTPLSGNLTAKRPATKEITSEDPPPSKRNKTNKTRYITHDSVKGYSAKMGETLGKEVRHYYIHFPEDPDRLQSWTEDLERVWPLVVKVIQIVSQEMVYVKVRFYFRFFMVKTTLTPDNKEEEIRQQGDVATEMRFYQHSSIEEYAKEDLGIINAQVGEYEGHGSGYHFERSELLRIDFLKCQHPEEKVSTSDKGKEKEINK